MIHTNLTRFRGRVLDVQETLERAAHEFYTLSVHLKKLDKSTAKVLENELTEELRKVALEMTVVKLYATDLCRQLSEANAKLRLEISK